MPQKEVAERLGVTQKTIEKHVMKGMKLLAAALFRTESGHPDESAQNADPKEAEHGKP
jgi:hypothetical protein